MALVANKVSLASTASRPAVARRATVRVQAADGGAINPSIKKDSEKVVDIIKAADLPKPKVARVSPRCLTSRVLFSMALSLTHVVVLHQGCHVPLLALRHVPHVRWRARKPQQGYRRQRGPADCGHIGAVSAAMSEERRR